MVQCSLTINANKCVWCGDEANTLVVVPLLTCYKQTFDYQNYICGILHTQYTGTRMLLSSARLTTAALHASFCSNCSSALESPLATWHAKAIAKTPQSARSPGLLLSTDLLKRDPLGREHIYICASCCSMLDITQWSAFRTHVRRECAKARPVRDVKLGLGLHGGYQNSLPAAFYSAHSSLSSIVLLYYNCIIVLYTVSRPV